MGRVKIEPTTQCILFGLNNFRPIPNLYPVQIQPDPQTSGWIELVLGFYIAPEFYTKERHRLIHS